MLRLLRKNLHAQKLEILSCMQTTCKISILNYISLIIISQYIYLNKNTTSIKLEGMNTNFSISIGIRLMIKLKGMNTNFSISKLVIKWKGNYMELWIDQWTGLGYRNSLTIAACRTLKFSNVVLGRQGELVT
jgi:hypothetical protein